MAKTLKPRNMIAKALACKSLRARVVAPRKGKGSYKRTGKVA